MFGSERASEAAFTQVEFMWTQQNIWYYTTVELWCTTQRPLFSWMLVHKLSKRAAAQAAARLVQQLQCRNRFFPIKGIWSAPVYVKIKKHPEKVCVYVLRRHEWNPSHQNISWNTPRKEATSHPAHWLIWTCIITHKNNVNVIIGRKGLTSLKMLSLQ